MKNIKLCLILVVLLFIHLGVSFAQTNTIDGIWYYIDNGDEINIRIFKENQTTSFSFRLASTSTNNIKPMSLSFKPYTIESICQIKIDGKIYEYYTSPLILILYESIGWGSEKYCYYHPVLEMNSNSLIGNWIIPGEEFDIEVEITAKTLTLTKGKSKKSFSLSLPGFPVISLKDSNGTNYNRNYFFFGADIVALNIPGESGAMIF